MIFSMGCICFRWTDLTPEDVEVVDYPKKKCLRKEENYGPDSYTSCATHPSEMPLEEFLNPMSLTQRELAGAIHVPYQRKMIWFIDVEA
jgi:hypothetical protein